MSELPNAEQPQAAAEASPSGRPNQSASISRSVAESVGSSRRTPKEQQDRRPEWRVSNRTSYRLAVKGRAAQTTDRILPPFAEVDLTHQEYAALDLKRWKSLGLIKSERIRPQSPGGIIVSLSIAIGILFYAGIGWLIWSAVREPPALYWKTVFLIIAVAVGVFLAVNLISSKDRLFSLSRRMVQSTGMLLVIALAYGLPAYVIVTFGGMSPEDETVNRNETVSGPNRQSVEIPSDTSATRSFSSRVVTEAKHVAGHVRDALARLRQLLIPLSTEVHDLHRLGCLLQLLFIGTFASLPGLLFYLFDRQRLSTLRERFFRSALALHPCLLTIEDAISVYGTQADEALGRDLEQTCVGCAERVRRAKRLVVVVATLVMTIGWILCLQPGGNAPKSGRADAGLLAYFTPAPDPLVFAFLGSYVFAIGLLLRLYVRSDLKPKTYAHVCVRIITSIALGWAVSAIPIVPDSTSQTPDPTVTLQNSSNDSSVSGASDGKSGPSSDAGSTSRSQTVSADNAAGRDLFAAWRGVRWKGYVLLVLAFNIGFFPSLGFAVMREFLHSRKSVQWMIPSMEERLPLDGLDGINIYHRVRLQDEGIENVENLAHADLIDLLLQTRYPLPTLADWVDQAILYLHVRCTVYPGSEGASADSKAEADKGELDRSTAIDRLRCYGIRTATDLEQTYAKFAGNTKKRDEFLAILGPTSGKPKKLEVVLQAIKDDEWMPHLRYCRDTERFKLHAFSLDELKKKLGLGPD